MKKLLLFFTLSLSVTFATSFYEPNDKSFRDGFQAGLKALEFQRKNDGLQPQKIEINKPFLLVFETKNTPLSEALFLQVIASREGYDTHITKDFVSFGGFDREADAKEIAQQLQKKFKITLKILRNQSFIVSYPFLWTDFYTKLLQEAIEKGVIPEIEVIEQRVVREIVVRQQQSQPQETIKNFTLKNAKAMSYRVVGTNSDSRNFKEMTLTNTKEYQLGRVVTTSNGEKFVKVRDKNIYFAIDDVNL